MYFLTSLRSTNKIQIGRIKSKQAKRPDSLSPAKKCIFHRNHWTCTTRFLPDILIAKRRLEGNATPRGSSSVSPEFIRFNSTILAGLIGRMYEHGNQPLVLSKETHRYHLNHARPVYRLSFKKRRFNFILCLHQ